MMLDVEGAKPPRVSPEHLITFYFVARGQSFTEASDQLCLSQPTVFLHIRAIEKTFGVKLLHIKKKRVTLTEAGEALLPYAKELYHQAKGAEQYLENLKEKVLRVGVALTLAPDITTVAGKFQEFYPSINVKIEEGPSYRIAEETSNLQHDLAVVARLNYGGRKLEAIEVSPGEKMVFIASPTDPLFRENELELTHLNGHPLILPPPKSATREALLRKLAEQGIEPTIIAEVDNPAGVKRLAEMGKGIALVLETNVEEEIASGRLRVLPFKEDVRIGVDILVHKDNPLHPMADRFISLVKDAYQSHSLARTP